MDAPAPVFDAVTGAPAAGAAAAPAAGNTGGALMLNGQLMVPSPTAFGTYVPASNAGIDPNAGVTNIVNTTGMAAVPGAGELLGAPGTLAPAPIGNIVVGGGGSDADAALVTQAMTLLKTSANGAFIANLLTGSGAQISVLSDQEFAAMGESTAHAFYDPNKDTLFLRRSDLQGDVKLAAVEIAHEGTHMLDDKGRIGKAAIDDARRAAGALTDPAASAAAMKQADFEHTILMEARAFTFSGQVARELGLQLTANDPTMVAAAGSNDTATYQKVWDKLLSSGYNQDHRSARITYS